MKNTDKNSLVVGVDTGGTFTDFTWCDGDEWGEYKLLSTPSDPAEAVLAGLRHIAGERGFDLVHGSTVATNAILEKKGAKTALVTNRRFEDVLEIGRQNRPELYRLAVRREPPLIPAELRFGIPGRFSAEGEELEPFDEEAMQQVAERLRAAKVESIAVSLLFSFARPEHELKVREQLTGLDIPVSLSHQTLSEFREYERSSTTVINAYVTPKMENYIGRLGKEVGNRRFRIMQSNGGSISAETAMQESVRTILSGPAGGVVGAWQVGKQAGFDRLITFDMGGTSTDVALLDGRLPLTTESTIAGYPVKVPMLDIHTVGAGGGSMASIDSGGSLKVGPESAGADPGPICYGEGEAVTVTDANLFLGRLVPEHFLGGAMRLQDERIAPYVEQLARQLDITPVELAQGVLDIANTTMERAIKVISVEKGHDPREFTLFSFGGAGGMHAAELARLLQIPTVLLPANPGVLSAGGMLMADIVKDYSLTVMCDQERTRSDEIETAFAPLLEQGHKDLLHEGGEAERIRLERYLDMRYRGQSHEIMVPLADDPIAEFHRMHERLYGYADVGREIETVNIRLRAVGQPQRPSLYELPAGGETPAPEACLGERDVCFAGREYRAPVYRRDKLGNGNRFAGPAIIVEYSSTIVVPPAAEGEVDRFGNIVLKIGEVES